MAATPCIQPVPAVCRSAVHRVPGKPQVAMDKEARLGSGSLKGAEAQGQDHFISIPSRHKVASIRKEWLGTKGHGWNSAAGKSVAGTDAWARPDECEAQGSTGGLRTRTGYCDPESRCQSHDAGDITGFARGYRVGAVGVKTTFPNAYPVR